ncbi:MAG: sigma-70 family RNA polymerase sigma factor [Phycisphaeraceae bacterium]|nr:sigma-70 family RNA polymerase sigma factor [Phycisphaeraceae bacterium]
MSKTPTNNLTLLWMQAQPVVEAYLNSLIRDRAIAEDVLQQVALTCTEKFDEFDTARSFTGWAMGIARNKALQYFQKHGSDRHRFSDKLLGQLADTHERLSDQAQEQREALALCIEKLPPKSLALIKRRYAQDLKPGRIADTLGLSANAVRLALHRIRKALRTCIEQRINEG